MTCHSSPDVVCYAHASGHPPAIGAVVFVVLFVTCFVILPVIVTHLCPIDIDA